MFELHIECTKDVDELYINFSDGTSSVVGNSTSRINKTQSVKSSRKKNTKSDYKKDKVHEDFLDTDISYDSVQQEIVELPEISSETREVNVADELQNLDI